MSLASLAIDVEGADRTAVLRPYLETVDMVDAQGAESDTLSLTLTNPDGRIELPASDRLIALSVDRALIGRFTVDAVALSGPPSKLTITARGMPFAGKMGVARFATFKDTTLGDIIKTIANENNLASRIHPRVNTIVIKHAIQDGESDWRFLTRLATANDVALKGADNLVFATVNGESPKGTAPAPLILAWKHLANYRFDKSDRHHYKSAAARWVEMDTCTIHTVHVGQDAPTLSLADTYHSEEDAKAAATRALTRAVRFSFSGEVSVIPANIQAFSGRSLRFNEAPPMFQATYQIEKAAHTFSAGGSKTTLTLAAIPPTA